MRYDVNDDTDVQVMGPGDKFFQFLLAPEARLYVYETHGREGRGRAGFRGPVFPVGAPLLGSEEIDGSYVISFLDVFKVYGNVSQVAEAYDFPVFIVEEPRVAVSVSPVDLCVAVDIGEDFKEYLPRTSGMTLTLPLQPLSWTHSVFLIFFRRTAKS